MTEEQRLILKIQRNGDRKAADCLIRLYYDEIFRFVHKQTADEETPLDLTQNIFISELQLSYITNVDAGNGLIKVGGSLVPFTNKFPRNTKLYRLMTTKLGEQ